MIIADRGGKHMTWDMPAHDIVPRAPEGPEIDEIRQATLRLLKERVTDRLVTREGRYLQPIDLYVARKGSVAHPWSGN